MRRIIIALVAFVGLTGFAEAYPAHHYRHYRIAFGYRHYVPHLHLRAYHRSSGYYRHAYHVRRRAAALPAGPGQPALFGTQEQPQALSDQASSFAAPSEAGRVVRASWYGGGERLSSRTASGEHFDRGGLTAAHRSLPFGTRVQVTNVQTGRAVVVRINDRGPFVRGRSLDLARGAAQAIGLSSVGQVRMVVLN
jgi:rare lipoprotein A